MIRKQLARNLYAISINLILVLSAYGQSANNFVLAGTSPSGFILKSTNDGQFWLNEGSVNKGNPLAFCKLSNGNIFYTTDQGYVVNYAQKTSVFLGAAPIYSIATNGTEIYVLHGGKVKTSLDNGVTFSSGGSFGIASIGQLLYVYSSLYCFTTGGIYKFISDEVGFSLIHSDNFTCACDAGNGFIYAGTNNGHIWKNTNANDFTAWTDLGNKTIPTWSAHGLNGNWYAIAMSSDGSRQTALNYGGKIYTSSDYGQTWTAHEIDRQWCTVALSADGSKQTVAVAWGGQIYTSSDYGETWVARESNRQWRSIAMSFDGSRQTALDYGGKIYTSSDFGQTWTARESNRSWYSVAMSSDGNRQTAVNAGGQIYISADFGQTWTARESNRQWRSVALSSDGSRQTAIVKGGQIYTSLDYGQTWTARESNRSWYSVAMSSDGKRQTAVEEFGQIYTSSDYGQTWVAHESSRYWKSVDMSSDGSRQTAVDNERIYTSSDFNAIADVVRLNNGRIGYIQNEKYFNYTDDNFNSFNYVSIPSNPVKLIHVNSDNVLIGCEQGKILRSTNNGLSFNDLGQQYIQSRINCLVANVQVIPAAPTGEAKQTFSSNSNPTLNNIIVSGTSIKWYNAATGGQNLSINTPLVNGTTYYATQTIDGVESTDRLAVTVYILAPGTPGGILAGTSPDGKILQSMDAGLTFNDLGSAGLGNPLAFCKLPSGDVLYTTDQGWVINYTKGTSLKVSDYPIRAISYGDIKDYNYIQLGDDNGSTYYSSDNGISFTYTVTEPSHSRFNTIIYCGTDRFPAFTSTGIYNLWTSLTSPMQAGNFTCAYYDKPNAFIYAGTANGHIWRNTTANNYYNWTDLGAIYYQPLNINYIIKAENNRFICGLSGEYKLLITDDGFQTYRLSNDDYRPNTSAIYLGNNRILGAYNMAPNVNGLSVSNDNGETWTNLGQQFSQTSINCLINAVENFIPPSAPKALAGTNSTCTQITANWESVADATNYYLDVATDNAFSNPVEGYQNLQTGGVTSYDITGLTPNSTYYYRVRAGNDNGTSDNSETITCSTLPSNECTTSETGILAGTSPDGLILKSADNGQTWTSEGSVNKGNPLAFCNLSNGDLVCSTDLGYVCNLTRNTQIKVSNYAIRAIFYNQLSDVIYIGDDNSDLYVLYNDNTLAKDGSSCNKVGQINSILLINYTLLIFGETGIYNNDVYAVVQSGNFTSVCYDETNGFVYAGTNNGHILKNSVANVFSGANSWVDLGLIDQRYPISNLLKTNDGFIYTYSGTGKFFYGWADEEFLSTNNASYPGIGEITSIIKTNSNYVFGLNNGHICVLNNLGQMPTDLGQQFSQTSINCLFSTSNINSKPPAPTALESSNSTCTQITANWQSVTGATNYYLDVATDNAFSSFVEGYQNLEAGDVTSYDITGLTPNTTYYYRVRAVNDNGTSDNSETITCSTLASNECGSSGTEVILAGTSPDGLILKSTDNGQTWTSEGSIGKGNPLAFCKHSNGDIFYTTDQGYVVNYTQSTSVKVSDHPIMGIQEMNNVIVVFDTNKELYASLDGITYFNSSTFYFAGEIRYFYWKQSIALLFTSTGIYDFADNLIQNGNFNCASPVKDGFIYAGTIDGHIWRNTNAYDYYLWTDLGIKTDNPPINSILKLSNGRLGINCTNQNSPPWFHYSDDNFNTMNYSTIGVNQGSPLCGISLSDNKVILGDNSGHFYLSEDNGENFTYSDHLFSQSKINCLFYTGENNTPPSVPTALESTDATCTQITANWESVTGATNYFLDVATDNAFNNFVDGYENLVTGDVTSHQITGLAPGKIYYYRVRSVNDNGISYNSETITSSTLPSSECGSSETNAILAGTSPDGLILKSVDNGQTWTSEGSIGKGNPLAFCKIENAYRESANGNILYVTDQGWFIDYTNSVNVKISNYALNAISFNKYDEIPMYRNHIYIGDINGDIYGSNPIDYDFNLSYSFGYKINSIIENSKGELLSFTSNGIYNCEDIIQPGNFTCSYYDDVNGFIYSGTIDGHIWKNTNANDFSLWTDLGVKTDNPPINAIIKLSNGRLGFNCTNQNSPPWFHYTDDNFNTINYFSHGVHFGSPLCGISLNDNKVILGDNGGYFYSSIDNGENFTYSDRQFSQTSINCLISTGETNIPPSPPTPLAGSNATCTQITANWQSVTGATNYYLDVATDNAFSSFVEGYQNLEAGDVTSYDITGLTSNTTYYYRVRAVNGNGTSDNSETITCSTLPSDQCGSSEAGVILAGTSPDGLILKSTDNGQTWTSEGSASKGNPLVFALINGDVTYGTDKGWFVNHTKRYSTHIFNYPLYEYPITAINYLESDNFILVATDGHGLLGSSDNGNSFSPYGCAVPYSAKTNSIFRPSSDVILYITNQGIYNLHNILQSGNFTCGFYDEANGFIYAGTADGHIWRNSIINDFTVWTDLVHLTNGKAIQFIQVDKGEHFNVNADLGFGAEDEYHYYHIQTNQIDVIYWSFSSVNVLTGILNANSQNIFGLGNGHIFGNWTDLDQQFSQASINCLLAANINNTSPEITTPPSSLTQCEGTDATFEVTASGSNLTYQWRKDGTEIPDATDPSLTLSNISLSDAGTYDVVVSSGNNSITSDPATLTVNASSPLLIEIEAESDLISPGTPVTFTATATNGGPSQVFQWKVNNNNDGGNLNTFTYQPSDGDIVTCELTSNESCVSGSPAVSNGIPVTVKKLLAYFPFAGNVNDETGNANAGTIYGATLSEDRCEVENNAYSFNGINNYIQYDPAFISGRNHGTFSAWVKFNDLSKTQYVASAGNTQNNENYISLVRLDPTYKVISIYCHTTIGNSYVIGSTPIIAGVFYHVAMTSDGSTWNLFVNGNKETLRVISGANTGAWMNDIDLQNITFGDLKTNTPAYPAPLNGILDDIRFFNWALSDAEISALHNESEQLNASVSITANPGTVICTGSELNLTATAINGGKNPVYQWIVNNMTVASGKSFSFSPNNGDKIKCQLTSTNACVAVKSVESEEITITNLDKPVITRSPLNKTVCQYNIANFSVIYTGTNLSFLWECSTDGGLTWSPVNSITSVYSVLATPQMNGNLYRCTISNSCGSVISANAVLTVNGTPQIIDQTPAQIVCNSEKATFSVTVTGANVSYQWQQSSDGKEYGNIDEEVSPVLELTATPELNGTYVRCKISGNCGNSVYSVPALLTVNSIPVISKDPENNVVCEGNKANFIVIANDGNLQYQWNYSLNGSYWEELDGEINPALEFNAAVSDNNKLYSCKVTNTCGSIISNSAQLTVNTPPVLNNGPSDQVVCEGNPASFNVDANGYNITYQWQQSNDNKDWNNINGETASNYLIPNTSVALNTTYYKCLINGGCGSTIVSGSAMLTVNSNTLITKQPENQALCTGMTASFNVIAAGTGLTYQWQRLISGTWRDISGQNQPAYSFNVTSGLNNSRYHCVVTGLCGTVISNTVLLTVGPQITNQLTNKAACEGTSVTFGPIEAIGVGPFTYQWQKYNNRTWENVVDGNNASYSFTATSLLNRSRYRCNVKSSCGNSVSSNIATLTVQNKPVVNTPLVSQTVCENSIVTFSTTASGSGLSYQWKYSPDNGLTWQNVQSATRYVYSHRAAYSENGYQYKCVVTGSCGNAESNTANLTVNPRTRILDQPKPQALCDGMKATFSVTATGTNLTYQWQEFNSGWSNLQGKNASTLEFTAYTNMHNRRYRCIVTGSCSSVTSNAAVLIIGVRITTPPVNIAACKGQSFTLGNLNVIGPGPYTYTWQQLVPGSTRWTTVSTSESYTALATMSMNGYRYRCTVRGSCGNPATTTAVTLTVNETVIKTHPTDQNVCENQTATFTAEATGPNIGYQWQLSTDEGYNWRNIDGATTASYSLLSQLHMNGYLYRCKITSDCGTYYSSTGKLTVNSLPQIVSNPENQAICNSNLATFKVTSSGENITYRWLYSNDRGTSWNNIAEANNSEYSFTVNSSDNLNLYHCSISNTCGTINSEDALLTINEPAQILVQPENKSVCPGEYALFICEATGYLINFQWQKSIDGIAWENIEGENETEFKTMCYPEISGTKFKCIVTGNCGNPVESDVVTLTVITPPGIVNQPMNNTICEGDQTNFSVISNEVGLSYQWQEYTNSWTDIDGQTNNTLAFVPSVTEDGKYYRCILSGTCVTSSKRALLKLKSSPAVTKQPSDLTTCLGNVVGFGIDASGADLSYQWQISKDGGNSWDNIAGSNGQFYKTTGEAILNGNMYKCIVNGSCSPSAVSEPATLTVLTNPQITTQPADQTVVEGNTATFLLNAIGTDLSYQWQTYDGNWNNIQYANSNSYSFTATGLENEVYRCIVNNICISDISKLNVTPRPYISEQPVNQTICEEETASFSVEAIGNNLNYQWQFRNRDDAAWDNIVTATNSTYQVKASLLSDGYYRCIINQSTDVILTSNSVRLLVNYNPVFTKQPENQRACKETQAGFSGIVSGTGIVYQWKVSTDGTEWNNIPYANTATFYERANEQTINNQYRLVATGSCATSYSDAVKLSLIPAEEITTNPLPQALCPGDLAVFSITANGENIQYRWQHNLYNVWNDIDNSNSSSYSITASSDYHNRQFRCVVTGNCGTLNSEPARLTLGPQVTSYLKNVEACHDEEVTFGPVVAIGKTPLSYQWEVSTDNGRTYSPIVGENSDTYTLLTPASLDKNVYHCIVTNDCGSDASNAFRLNIVYTSISQNPDDAEVCEGNSTDFKITASGINLQYKWEKSSDGQNWNEIYGATSATYNINPVTLTADNTLYRCKVKGKCDVEWTYSSSAKLTVIHNTIPVLTSSVKTVTCEDGNDGAVYINTPGSYYSPINIKWSNGATTEDITSLTTGNYSVVVTDQKGCTRSASGNVTLDPPLEASIVTTQVSIPGVPTGEIEITVSKGHTPYSYSWNTGQTDAFITGLAAGDYSVNVTDSKGCVKEYKTTLKEEPPVSETYIEAKNVPTNKAYVIDTKEQVGTIIGTPNVSPSGAASYEIPLPVSPGVNGLQPNISVAYNSQSGNGLLGWGWNLAGLSVISRVQQNKFSDAGPRGIEIDAEDKYALNGNRLVIKDGTYGADNSTYNTEVETFLKITAHGQYGNTGPEWFEVETRDGIKYRYGSKTGKLLYNKTEATFPNWIKKDAVLTWYLDYVEDQFGNFIEYTYQQDQLFNYLIRINYGSKTDDKIGQVELNYAERTDPMPVHFQDLNGKIHLILSTVSLKSSNQLYRKYCFGYSKDRFDRLVKITEYNGAGESLNPTIIEWGDYNSGVRVSDVSVTAQPSVYSFSDFKKNTYMAPGDMNSDGISDILGLDDDGSAAFTYQSKITASGIQFVPGSAASVNYRDETINNGESSIGDIDGDDNSEVFFPYSIKYMNKWETWFEYLKIKKPYFEWVENLDNYFYSTPTSSEVPVYAFADFNNDGVDDRFFIEKGKKDGYYPGGILWHYQAVDSKGNKYYTWKICPLNIWKSEDGKPSKVMIADFDADGMKDIMLLNADNSYKIFKNKGGSGDFSTYFSSDYYVSGLFGKGYDFKPGDFNGDGLLDYILHRKNTGFPDWKFYINTGHFTFKAVSLPNITAFDDNRTVYDDKEDNVIVYDFNNDAKSDVIIFDARFHDASSGWESSYYRFNDLYVNWYKSDGESLSLVKSTTSKNEKDAFSRYYITGDFNGDGRMELMNYGFDCYGGTDMTQKWRIYSLPDDNHNRNFVKSVTNGFRNQIEINYAPLTDNSVYEKTSKGKAPMYVVKSLSHDDGSGGKSTTSYFYEGSTVNKTGKGFLGFTKITQTNDNSNITSVTTSEYNAQFACVDNQTTEMFVGTQKISKSYSKFKANQYEGRHAYISQDYTQTIDYLKKLTMYNKYTYSTSGNLSEQTSTFYDYIVDEGSYYHFDYKFNYMIIKKYEGYDNIGNPASVKTTMSKKGNEGYTTQSELYTYYTSGKIKTATINGVVTTYAYDNYGNISNITTSAISKDVDDRTTIYEYDPTQRFIAKKKNVLDAATTFTASESYYDALGNLTSSKGLNGEITTNTYNNWNAIVKINTPDGKQMSSVMDWAKHSLRFIHGDDNAPENALYYVEEKLNDQHVRTKYFDKLSRSIRQVVSVESGKRVITDIEYNSKNQLIKKTDPYPEGSSPSKISTYEYDDFGRLFKEHLPEAIDVTYSYDGNKVTKEMSTGEIYTKQFDVTGQLIASTDPGGTITYNYNNRNEVKASVSPGNTVNTSYNAYGLISQVSDANIGATTYGYNSFGEIISTTEPAINKETAKRSTTLSYDNLGRLKKKTLNGVVTDYTYDKGTKALGTLSEMKTDDGTGIKYTYSDDGLCNVTEMSKYKGAESYSFKYEYDYQRKWLVNKVVFPAGFEVYYKYSADNILKGIYRDRSKTDPVWELISTSDLGQIKIAEHAGKRVFYDYDENERLNNIHVNDILDFKYKFNSKGQLEYRDETYEVGSSWLGFREDFTYDDVNRLKTASIGGVEILNMTYKTGVNDRIETKSDVGTYSYGSNQRINELHTVQAYLPTNHSLTYTTAGMVSTITENAKLMSFEYGPDDMRFKMHYSEDGNEKYTRIYFGDYEKEISADGNERSINYIYAGNSLVAIYEQKKSGNAMHVVYTDYLGSIRCITTTDDVVEQRLSFDAWGNRRDPLTGTKYTSPPGDLMFARGFTGHEHLDEFDLINMNGRVYDPQLGMFISPDPYIQSPDYTQSYNRYAYAMNNPLMYTDPSGYTWMSHFGGWVSENWKTIVTVAAAVTASIITAGLIDAAYGIVFITSLSSFVGGFVGGAVSTALNGGDISDIVGNAIMGAGAGGIVGLATGYLLGLLGAIPLPGSAPNSVTHVADMLPRMPLPVLAKITSATATSIAEVSEALVEPLAKQILRPRVQLNETPPNPMDQLQQTIRNMRPQLQEVRYPGVTITVNRTDYATNYTTGTISVSSPLTDETLDGVTLEPQGPPSTVEGSNRLTTPGTYNVIPHNTTALPNTFEIVNVPGRTSICIHSGSQRSHTVGCLLVGTGFTGNTSGRIIDGSPEMMNRLRDFITANRGLTRGIRIIMN